MSSSTAGAGGSTTTERLQGSLRNSAIARLLVEGRLSSSSSPAVADKVDDRGRRRAEVHSPPPPIDLSTNRTSGKQVNVNDSAAAAAAAVASFSLSTITTMEKLRCILACEVQSLLSRVGSTDQSTSSSTSSTSSSNSIRYSCRLCPFNVSQVIELLNHYRFHGDTLAHIGHSSPEILSGWFEYYLKTSRCSSQSLTAGVNEAFGVMTPTADSSSSSSSPAFHLDLRTLLLQPFKATNALLQSSTMDHRSPSGGRHRACSESHPLRPGCRATGDGGGGGAQSRSSTPYTTISGLTDDENQQQTVVYTVDRCPRWGGPANGRQSAGVYPDEVSVKCEAEATAASPVRSPMSTNLERSVKDKGPNSQDSQSLDAEYLGQFQNGRLQRLVGGRMATEDRSPPTLKCEVDSSPCPDDDRASVSHCFEFEDKYLAIIRGHPPPKEALRKSSYIPRHPGLRACDDRSPSRGSHPGPSSTPSSSKDTALPADQPEDGLQTGKQSRSPAPTQFRETVEQEYAYKQYKRLRKSNTPKSCRQEALVSPCHSFSKTPDDSGLSGTPSLTCDGSEMPQRGCVAQLAGTERSCSSSSSTKRAPPSYEIGVQCSLISLVEPYAGVTEEDGYDNDEEADDETKDEEEEQRRMGRSVKRVRRKRAFPADENEMPDITASDADCVQSRCSPCGITFDDDVIFSIHMGCHSHTDPFVCNICGRSCDNKYAFNTHILRGHHPT